MEESTTREKILKKIRAALLSKSPDPYPHLDNESRVFNQPDEDPVVIFSENFIANGGNFFLCSSELEFVEGLLDISEQYKWNNIYCADEGLSNLLTECEFPHVFEMDPESLNVAVTSCECLIARTGTIVISSKSNGFVMPVFAPVHIVCARSSQMAMEMKDALHWLKSRYGKLPSGTTFISGPSSNKNNEKQNINTGISPSLLYIFLIDDRQSGYIEPAPDEVSNDEK